jgi:hypothetical protein
MNGRDDPSTLVSYVEVFSLSDSYALWKSRRSPETKPDGRQLGCLLERIRNHHREHGHLGKRYAEVIRLFEPSFEYGRKHAWQREASFVPSAQ